MEKMDRPPSVSDQQKKAMKSKNNTFHLYEH